MKKSKLIYSIGALPILTSPLLLASISCSSTSGEKENLYTSSYFKNLSESEKELLLDEIATSTVPHYNKKIQDKVADFWYYDSNYVDYYDPVEQKMNYNSHLIDNITFNITYDIFDKISYTDLLKHYLSSRTMDFNGEFFSGVTPSDNIYAYVLNKEKLESAIDSFKSKNNSPILRIDFWCDSYVRFLFDSWFWDYFPELRVIENDWSGLSAFNVDTGVLNNLPPKLIQINGFGKKNDLTQIDFSNNKKLKIIIDSFDYNNITQLQLPDSLKIINGFNYLPFISNVDYPNSIEGISGFKNCKIGNLQLPSSLKYLEIIPEDNYKVNYEFYSKDNFIHNTIPTLSLPFRQNSISTISASRKFQPYFESQTFLDNNNGITPTITYVD